MFKVCDAVHDLEVLVRATARQAERKLDEGVCGKVKTDVGDSHHSVGTPVDDACQASILGWARQNWPGVHFLAEESTEGADIIQDATVENLFHQDQLVCVVDALDGTASAYRKRWDWSVCAHLLKGGRYLGGCIMAPKVRGGFGVVVDADCGGSWLSEGKAVATPFWEDCHVSEWPWLRESTVLFGMDLPRRWQFLSFQHVVAHAAETSLTCGSCALGVATVVTGRAEAMVQPQQWPWDWVSAYMIQVAGGKVIWFHYRNGQLVRLEEPDLASYSRLNRRDQGGLAFIGGNPAVVDELWSLLNKTWLPLDWQWPG